MNALLQYLSRVGYATASECAAALGVDRAKARTLLGRGRAAGTLACTTTKPPTYYLTPRSPT